MEKKHLIVRNQYGEIVAEVPLDESDYGRFSLMRSDDMRRFLTYPFADGDKLTFEIE